MPPAPSSHLLPTFAKADIAFERGDGAWLTATNGDRYLDFGSGIAVNALGHGHPHLVKALVDQAQKVWHVSNLYQIPEGVRLAERLAEATGLDYAFFANSGAEANEGAIKTARKYHAVSGHPEKIRIITFEGAFHGRTLATLAAGGQQKYLEGFGPKAEGFDQVPFGDFEALKIAVTPETAAIMLEPTQMEGGVRPFSPATLRAIRALCDEHGLLLIFDEIQTGVGRSGKLFQHEWAGVKPDIMSVAKGIGGGFPLGLFLTTKEAGKGMTAGTHGTTFGGNPLAMAVGNAVLDVVLAPGFLDAVQNNALLLKQRLAELKDRHPRVIEEIRGEGLLIGLKSKVPNTDLAAAARAEKLLSVPAGDNTLRLLPPLTTTAEEINEAVKRLDAACAAIERTLDNKKDAAA
ncbi:MAG: acetylornithine transaminase [Rhizobiales bacterium 65-9]|nr:aspartate aminotransferase family protein [Hyphomicrobiales bacterium]OJY37285.1 MAG: acetylornithine transaminase [Rhizobiales bacterium 65-9]